MKNALYFVFFYFTSSGQIANYINNAGFEELVTNTATPNFPAPKFWGATDSSKFFAEVLSKTFTPVQVPLCSYTYQWTRHGNNHIITKDYCPTCPNIKRGYPRNRLKQILKPNTSYCFSMYVNLSNQSTHAIDALGAYFGDSSLDTITKCNTTIDYLIPQVSNPVNNIIADTLNWVLIRGQFIANGTEKYAMIGNFKSDANTNTLLVNSSHLPSNFTDYLIDDVSLIESNLSAFAGRDTVFTPGDSLFLGREPDVGIDEACVWYKLPGNTPIDTIAGFWIKPTTTSTYVVRQEICGLVKWDTVTVYLNAVGINELNPDSYREDELKIYPVPASDQLEIRIVHEELFREFKTLSIFNNLGMLIREEEFSFKGTVVKLEINDLPEGVYLLQLKGNDEGVISKRFVISR
jgi:hypothetical protein